MTPAEIATRVQRTVLLLRKRTRTCGEILELSKNKLWIRWSLYQELLDLEGKNSADQGADTRSKR